MTTGRRRPTRRRAWSAPAPSGWPWTGRRGYGRWSVGSCAAAGHRARSRAGWPPITPTIRLVGCLTRRSTSGSTPSRCPPLARELIGLRTGRTARRGGRRPPPAPRIREPVYIDDRPAEVTGRAVPGHWEGDLVIGRDGKTAVATLVERTSRFLILVGLGGRDALTVGDAVIAATGGLPSPIRRSLTWDCGSEMARHASITATGLPVFFAHPHSPWERGSNENLNRIVREFFPKGTDITADPNYLAMVACDINDRPRKIHNWKKPSELFTELVEANASTA